MKKLLNIDCDTIAFNDNYACFVGIDINIYKTNDFIHICTFTDMKNCHCIQFINKSKIVAKNTLGIYKIFDIENKCCIRTIKINKILKGCQDSKFILSYEKDYIYDIIIRTMFNDVWFVKIEVETGKVDHIRIGDDIRVTKNLMYDEKTKKVRFMHSKAIGEIDGELKSMIEIYEADPYQMKCDSIFSKVVPISSDGLIFYDNQFILLQNMDVVNIISNQTIDSINYKFIPTQYLYYIYGFLHMNNKYLILVHARKTVIVDFHSGTIIREYSVNSQCATFYKQALFIGTFDTVLVDENPGL